MNLFEEDRDAKHGVRSGRKKMGRLTIPSENAGRTGPSRQTLRRKVRKEPTLGDLIRQDILETEE